MFGGRKDHGKNHGLSAEEAAEAEREFRAHIHEETVKSRGNLGAIIGDPNILQLGCVDKKVSRRQAEVPGGGLLLYLEGHLEEWFKNRKGMSGEFLVHVHCGYLFVEQSLNNSSQHVSTINGFINAINRLNHKYGCGFTVRVEQDGSAKPFMK